MNGISIGSPNPGHHAASAGVLFAARTGINANHAPFRGAAQTIPAMLALHNLASSVSQIKSGTVRPLAITGAALANVAESPRIVVTFSKGHLEK